VSAKKLTAAAATALAAATSLAVPAHAGNRPATFPGIDGPLAISTGDNTLHFDGGGTETMPSQKVMDAEWAPDGSRVAYVDENGNLVSVRYDGTDLIVVAGGLGGMPTHPTWIDGGSLIVFAFNGDLYKVPSLGGAAPVKLSDGHQPGDKDSAPQGGPRGSLVFQRTLGSNGQTWVWTYNGYSDTGLQLPNGINGSTPSLSPDGQTIAFSRPDPNNGINQIWTIKSDGSTAATEITTNAISHTQPIFSPNGGSIAFTDSGGVKVIPAAGGTERLASQLHGRLTWQPEADMSKPPSTANPVNLVERLDGADRIETAVQISHWSWDPTVSNPPASRQADIAVITRQDVPADALAGTALARQLKGGKGPLLLTETGNLDPRTLAELKRTLRPGSFVYVLGQTKAISANTFNQIAAAGFRPSRLGGEDRFETAVDVAETIVPTYTHDPVTVLTATGMDFPDALAAGAVAASRPNTVVVLTNDKVMPTPTLNFLNAVSQRTVFAVGGQAVTALNTVRMSAAPVFGGDRFITAAFVAKTFFGGPQVVGIATGYKFPDALAGGVLAGSVGGPLLLTGPTALPSATADYLRTASASVSDAIMFGGPEVLDEGIQNQVGDLIGQPGQWVYQENNPSAHVGPR
jgi:hypothetical protein